MKASMVTHVGMDVHKATISWCVRYPGESIDVEFKTSSTPESVSAAIRRIKARAPGAVHAYQEAGPTGYGLARQLEAEGVACSVLAPSKIPRAPGNKVKTDRLDARKVLDAGLDPKVAVVYVPTLAEEGARSLSRRLDTVRADVRRIQTQIKSLLLVLGVRLADTSEKKSWTKEYRRRLDALKLAEFGNQAALDDLLLALRLGEERIESLEKKLRELAGRTELGPMAAALGCLKGIAEATALQVAAEVTAPERFVSAPQMMHFIGIVPREDSSGERQWRGELTRTGNGRVRRLLIESAQHARHSPRKCSAALKKRRAGQPEWAVEIAQKAERRLNEKYWGLIHRGKPHNTAVAATARELIGFVWALMVRQSQERTPALRVDSDGVVITQ